MKLRLFYVSFPSFKLCFEFEDKVLHVLASWWSLKVNIQILSLFDWRDQTLGTERILWALWVDVLKKQILNSLPDL